MRQRPLERFSKGEKILFETVLCLWQEYSVRLVDMKHCLGLLFYSTHFMLHMLRR
jgi:hypothetical protein